MAPCLDDDLVLGFVEGRLPPDAVATVDAHMATCGGCRALVAETAKAYFPVGADTTTVPRQGTDAPSSEPAALAPGSSVGRYRVQGPLGEGGMGIVYEAYDPQLDRKVALKLLRAGASADADARDVVEAAERLLREARAMARIAHPNVVAVYDAGAFGDRVFVAMELVEGQTLGAWLQAAPRTWMAVIEAFRAAGRGLAAAHGAGLVHRDFKPHNVLVGPAERVRVTDFGLARPTAVATAPEGDPGAAPLPGVVSTLTRTGALVGTPAYMAPEQLLCSGPVDARTDQWSFAVALYEALYGQRPFPATTFGQLLAEVRSGRIAAEPRGTAVPASVRDVLVRALAVERQARFPSMDELLGALDTATAPQSAPAASAPASSHRRLLAVAIAIAGLGVAAPLVIARARPTPSSETTATSAGPSTNGASNASGATSANADGTASPSASLAATPPTDSSAVEGPTPRDLRSASPSPPKATARVNPAKRRTPSSASTAKAPPTIPIDDGALKPIGKP